MSGRPSTLLAGLSLAFAGLVGVGGALLLIPGMTAIAQPGWTAAPNAGGASPTTSDAAAVGEVVPPRPAPPLRLTGTDGQPFDDASLRGAPVLVFFGYTHCPDVCPLNLVDVRDAMKRSSTPVKAVFVSIDPDRDTPAEIGTYLSYYGVPIVGLTGTPAEVRATADAWGVRYSKLDEGGTSGYAMAHTADTFLVDANGMLRQVIPFGSGSDVMLQRVTAVAENPAPTPAVAGTTGSPAPAATPSVAGAFEVQLLSTSVRAGLSRLLIEIEDSDNKNIGKPDMVVTLAVRPADRPDDPPITAAATFIWVDVGVMGAYVADLTFPGAGQYEGMVSASSPAGPLGAVALPIRVDDAAPVVAVGAAAPSVDTPTAGDVGGDLQRISTDVYPNPRLYEESVADLLAEHRPFVLTIYSPTFCPTTACGPLLRNLKPIAAEFPDIGFVHVEPYLMEDFGTRIQPVLNDGKLQWAPWSIAYGIPLEPWIFVVDSSGRVTASYELIFGSDELRAALRSLSSD